jgi:DNA ligase-1
MVQDQWLEHTGGSSTMWSAAMTEFDLPVSRRRALLAVAGLWPVVPWAAARTPAADSGAPSIELLSPASADMDPAGYLVSEKFDGVRAIWDGRSLRFRSGRSIAAPAWFTEGWPDAALDGELWGGRGRFDVTSASARRSVPDDAEWRGLRLMVFDLPAAEGSFAQRAARIETLVRASASSALVTVDQQVLADRAALQQRLDSVVGGGGEGLVLHRADAPWVAGRSTAVFKLKPLHDAEAQVLACEAGRGRLVGLMGALRLRNVAGIEFRIGTGFTDEQRRHPPAVGSWISYTHRGHTPSGVPRFASYWRAAEVGL